VIYLVWTLTALLSFAGLAGTLVPLVPGTLLILVAAGRPQTSAATELS